MTDSFRLSRWLAFAALALTAACARVVPQPETQPPPVQQPAEPAQPDEPAEPVVQPPADPVVPPPANAAAAGVRLGPPVAFADMMAAERAMGAFRISCPSLLSRQDTSGLTRNEDWRALCEEAAQVAPGGAAAFFRDRFETVEVGDGAAFATGYYEPEIRGSRVRQPGYEVPVYGVPSDLLETNPLTGARGRGRIDETGAFVLYHDRAAIDAGALAGRGLEIGWAADPVDLFFLQIQGSGRLRLPDGQVMRIGYASQNGREYVAIGRILRDRQLIEPPVTMEKITTWLRANPEAGRGVMQENKSYVFFRELTGPGPLGALGRPVTPLASVAADPKFVPLGTPVVLSGMSDPRANGLWVAQDTGGAIRGANRFDTFWGAGAAAESIAGGMQARGRALLLLPRGTVARVTAGAAPTQP